jgi:nucleolar protein 14
VSFPLVCSHHHRPNSLLPHHRRFGEADADLSLEDKMFLRLQKEKIRRTKNNSSIYNLDSIPEENLTHHGQILGVSNINDRDANDDEDEDEEDKLLNKDIVNRLHFGGGLVKKDSDAAGSASHYDALQEIINKSKLQKQMKKQVKDEMEIERERLDAAFRELVSESAVEYRPVRGKVGRRGEEDEVEDGDEVEVDEYDKSLNAMTYEAKFRATDRTKTAEELAIEAKKKLEELEAARIARMKKPLTVDDDGPGDDQSRIVKNTKRMRSDDEIDFDDHLSNKKRPVTFTNPEHGDEDDEEEDDGSDDEDEDDGEDDEDDDDGEDDLDDEEGEDDEDEDEEDGEDLEDENDVEVEEDIAADKHKLREKFQSTLNQESSRGLLMPHKLLCPTTIDEFYDMTSQYTDKLADIETMIDRILIWNSPLLPGADGQTNKVAMHNFLDILFKYFVKVADTLGQADDSKEIIKHLDFLTVKIFKLCSEIKDAVPSLCGRWLKMMEAQLMKRLRDYSLGTHNSSTCYPSLGRLMLLKLYSHLFSLSDYHHAIANVMVLFLGQCLAQCPVENLADVASGLLIISILIDMIKGIGSRQISNTDAEEEDVDEGVSRYVYIPEIISYLSSLLSCYATASSIVSTASLANKNFNLTKLSSLRTSFEPTKTNPEAIALNKISWSCFSGDKCIDADSSAAIITSIYLQLSQFIELYESSVAIPEIVEEVVLVLRSIHPHQEPPLPVFIQQAHVDSLSKIFDVIQLQASSRSPLQWRKTSTYIIENKNPRFDVNYKLKKDMDEDRERALLKQLKRQFKREKKAATRELRRDHEFLDQVQYQEKLEQRREQQEERWKNFTWLEQQQALLNTHVKKFGGELKGGGKNGLKPVKHNRRQNRGPQKKSK